jgi:hypothetical protein
VLIDHDTVEDCNLDRILHAAQRHADAHTFKVDVPADAAKDSRAAETITARNPSASHSGWPTVARGLATAHRRAPPCLSGVPRRSTAEDVGLDSDGLLDEPDYIGGLSESDRERYHRRNVLLQPVRRRTRYCRS